MGTIDFREADFSGGGNLPALQQSLRIGERTVRRLLRRGPGGRNAFAIAIIAIVAWLSSGAFVVHPGYHLPWPTEAVLTPSATRENQVNIGYRLAASGAPADVPEESLSLTGDENIVDINFTVYWRIEDAGAFLFNVQNPALQPDATIRAVAESFMREVVGKSEIEPILTANREAVQQDVRVLMQSILESYNAGVRVTRVQMQKADPPAQVLKQQVIAVTQGEAQRFIAIYDEYKRSPEVTRRRIYIDTMQSILAGVDKVILDSNGGPGVVPYLSLPQLRSDPANAASSVVNSTQGR